jgi:hypothetical protein
MDEADERASKHPLAWWGFVPLVKAAFRPLAMHDNIRIRCCQVVFSRVCFHPGHCSLPFQISSFFTLFVTLIFGRMYGALNIGKINN